MSSVSTPKLVPTENAKRTNRVATHEYTVEGGKRWTRAQRTRWQGRAETVVHCAQSFAEKEGFETQLPKRFTFCKRRPGGKTSGECFGPSKIELAVSSRDLRRLGGEAPTFRELESAVHEAAHAHRFERFPDKLPPSLIDLPEHAVHEGFAYTCSAIALRKDNKQGGVAKLLSDVERLDSRTTTYKPIAEALMDTGCSLAEVLGMPATQILQLGSDLGAKR